MTTIPQPKADNFENRKLAGAVFSVLLEQHKNELGGLSVRETMQLASFESAKFRPNAQPIRRNGSVMSSAFGLTQPLRQTYFTIWCDIAARHPERAIEMVENSGVPMETFRKMFPRTYQKVGEGNDTEALKVIGKHYSDHEVYAKKYRGNFPDELGLALLHGRNDVTNQLYFFLENNRQNAQRLRNAEQNVNARNLYALHNLGPGDAMQVLRARGSDRLSTMLSGEVIRNNRSLTSGGTAASYLAAIDKNLARQTAMVDAVEHFREAHGINEDTLDTALSHIVYREYRPMAGARLALSDELKKNLAEGRYTPKARKERSWGDWFMDHWEEMGLAAAGLATAMVGYSVWSGLKDRVGDVFATIITVPLALLATVGGLFAYRAVKGEKEVVEWLDKGLDTIEEKTSEFVVGDLTPSGPAKNREASTGIG